MALRLIETTAPPDTCDRLEGKFKDEEVEILHTRSNELSDGRVQISLLVWAEDSEAILNFIDECSDGDEQSHTLVFPIEASLPREVKEEKEDQNGEKDEDPNPWKRISREELYVEVQDAGGISLNYIAWLILAAVVAAIGVVRDNPAVIIGSMVIAPLMGPSVALSLGTTLADRDLAKMAIKSNLLGCGLVILVAAALGLVMSVNMDSGQLTSRTHVSGGDFVLALAAGAAGALAFTSGTSTILVGVMVAAALLPPLVISGLLLVSGHFAQSVGAMLLFLVNFFSLNLAGVVTFWVQGIRPGKWWEEKRAKRATIIAILVWAGLLAALLVVLWLTGGL